MYGNRRSSKQTVFPSSGSSCGDSGGYCEALLDDGEGRNGRRIAHAESRRCRCAGTPVARGDDEKGMAGKSPGSFDREISPAILRYALIGPRGADVIAKHKRQVHSDERPFACNHTGCSFRGKTTDDLSQHKNMVHLNIRDKRCHVCEKGFCKTCLLRDHMKTHERNGHEVANCEDCSVNLRGKSSRKAEPTSGEPVACDHQGCDFKSKWKSSLWRHQTQRPL